MSLIVRENVHGWLKDTMLEENIKEYTTNIVGNSAQGDGYTSEISFVEVLGKTQDGKTKEFHYVVKSSKEQSEEVQEKVPLNKICRNEARFYRDIYPVFQKLQANKNIKNGFSYVAKCSKSLESRGILVLVLENLRKGGFEVHDRKKPLNLDHLRFTFRAYGKLHALSFVLKKEDPDLFRRLSESLEEVMSDFWTEDKMGGTTIRVFRDSHRFFEGDTEVIQKLKDLEGEICSTLTATASPDDPYSVLLHGDCWNNNFMFKYENEEKTAPTEVRFLDWQIIRPASPVWDLSYHLYSCASKTELDHFDELLQVYHDSLSELLQEAGYDAEELFPYEKLVEHWRLYAKYGFIFSYMVIKIALCDSEEAPDLTDIAKGEEGYNSMFLFKIKDEESYRSRLRDIVYHFAERNFM